MNEDATKNNLKVVSLKFSSISRISLTQTFSFILFLAMKRVRVNISLPFHVPTMNGSEEEQRIFYFWQSLNQL